VEEKELTSVIKEISTSVKTKITLEGKEMISKVAKLYFTGIPTPALSVCGRGTQEIRFTKYFSYYLDESKLHGMNDQLLKSVFMKEALEQELEPNWHSNCRVYSEFNLGKVQGSEHYQQG
jgi:hypothetical protein